MSYNLSLMVKVRKWAAESEDFDLRFWAAKKRYNECGTTLCLAGKGVVESGYDLVWKTSSPYGPSRYASSHHAYYCQLPGQEEQHIQDAGRDVFGLGAAEADELFSPNLTDNAMEIVGVTETDKVDTSEADEKFSLAFLDHLIERARENKPHLNESEVSEWRDQWCAENADVLAECGMEC